MKKLYTLAAAALVALTANAQNFTLSVHGETVKDGDRVDITKYWVETSSQYNPEFAITSTSNATAKVTAKLIKDDCSPKLSDDYLTGAKWSLLFCEEGGQCHDINEVGKSMSSDFTLTANQPKTIQVEFALFDKGDNQELEDLTIDFEFSVEVTVGSETSTVYMFGKQTPAGVEDITVDSNAPAVYFDLQGRKVANPEKGIYIKRQGAKATKVVL